MLDKIDKDEVLISKMVGLKLVEARKLSNQHTFTQHQAAELLGISQNDLRLMEEGFMQVPLGVIKKAAEVFYVSTDWLLWIVADDWELAPESRRERDFLSGLEMIHLESRAKAVAKQLEQDSRLAALSDAVAALGPAIQAIDDSFVQFWQKNPEFHDMPGGASVLGRIDQAQAAARAAVLQLVRAKALPVHTLSTLPPKPTIRVWKNPAPEQLPPPVAPIADHKPLSRKRNRAPVKSERQSSQSAELAAG
ncbi:helix-turn-helix domain-containing protein [Methylomonas sp. 2BW1-5-20]|uniref:helix-turn-helix domain-containing protein n=1 Tax=Methylomonas sp. 2BW1-5-20 TaxID=3376686 RepID=UPI00404FD40B